MGVLEQLAGERSAVRSSSDFPTFTIDEFGSLLQRNGLVIAGTLQAKIEEVENSFPGFVSAAYKSNAAVFALEVVRFLIFSQARFQFQQLRQGTPGDLFGTPELALFEKPWGGSSTTEDMLARMLLYADFAGNGYAVRRQRRSGPVIKLPRPDWMTILIGSPNEADDDLGGFDIDAEVLGYQYHAGGIGLAKRVVSLLPEDVGHFAPIPDPIARYRGQSIWRAAVSEVEADSAATAHKLAYYRNGATANAVVTVNNPAIKDPDDFKKWIDLFEEDHVGATNAYKTIYLANGADLHVVGSNLEEADLSKTQGASETLLASAAGIPAAIVGFSEGLSGSSLNKGNIQELKKLTGDKTFEPLWSNLCGSLGTLLRVPGGSRLWYDSSGISFLAEDVKEAADILAVKAQAIDSLTQAGFDSDSVVDAIVSNDLSRLTHTGLFSVQLQAPGSALGALPTTPIPATARSARARGTFWSAGGSVRGAIIEGTCVRLDDGNGRLNPWIEAYPSMFEASLEAPYEVLAMPEAPKQLVSGVRSEGEGVRCSNVTCGKLLAEAFSGDYYRGTCRYCKTVTEVRGTRTALLTAGESDSRLVDVVERMAELVGARGEPRTINVPPPDMTPIAEAIRSLESSLATRAEPEDVKLEWSGDNVVRIRTS